LPPHSEAPRYTQKEKGEQRSVSEQSPEKLDPVLWGTAGTPALRGIRITAVTPAAPKHPSFGTLICMTLN